jgi:hypothetical protein
MMLETAPLFRLMNLHAPCFVVYILSLSCWHSRSEDSVPVKVQSFFNSHHPRGVTGGFLMATGQGYFFEGCSQHCTRAGKLGKKKLIKMTISFEPPGGRY